MRCKLPLNKIKDVVSVLYLIIGVVYPKPSLCSLVWITRKQGIVRPCLFNVFDNDHGLANGFSTMNENWLYCNSNLLLRLGRSSSMFSYGMPFSFNAQTTLQLKALAQAPCNFTSVMFETRQCVQNRQAHNIIL